ncbi:Zn-dependent exopeptidase, partial [Rozella allomycis CSF55]
MKRINRIRIVRHKPVVGTVSRLYFSGDTKSRVSDDFAEETMSPSLYGIVPEPGDKHSENFATIYRRIVAPWSWLILFCQNFSMTIQVEVKKYRAHLILALFLGFIFALVVCLRDRLPTALSKEEADMNDEFSGILAYEDLKFIASDFHHVGSEHNLAVFLFIQEKLLHLSSEAKKLGLSMTVMYNKQPKLTPDNEDESEIPGQIFGLLEGQTKDTIMISAHYDSVEKSFGASDNGAGVTVALEVMRKVIRGGKKPKKSLMIFLNNGEEIGLRGSKWMVNQTVYERVTRVINLEGGGTGGRAILFRTNSFSMAAAYAQVAPYPHMNIFGEIVMQRLG